MNIFVIVKGCFSGAAENVEETVCSGKMGGFGPAVDDAKDDPEAFKQAFTGPLETRDFACEFLYLNEITEHGT